MTYNSSERKEIRRAEKAAKAADEETKTVFQDLVAQPRGRRWLWELLSTLSVFQPTYHGDIHAMLIAEGARNVGLRLLSDLMRYSPQAFTLMQDEANARDRDAERTDAGDDDADSLASARDGNHHYD